MSVNGASQNEVQLILNAIDDVRSDVKDVRADVIAHRAETAAMDSRINGRIRKLERFRWQLVGGAAAVSLIAGIVLRVVAL